MRESPPSDPTAVSWVPVPTDSGFPIQNLPFGVFETSDRRPRVGVAIGDHILDLAAITEDGFIPGIDPAVFRTGSLNPYLALGRDTWRLVRSRISKLLSAEDRSLQAGSYVVPMTVASLRIPIEVGDFVDFYSSLDHAENVGRILRPGSEPLADNWRRIPIGYHGRAGTVEVSGTPIVRPRGVIVNNEPVFEPTRALDFELELGFVTGNSRGPIDIASAEESIFGVCILNDWSARDIQAYEYRPLGPFLGKSFLTTISPWIVELDALIPFRVDPPEQIPESLTHLRSSGPTGFDIRMEAVINASRVTETNFRHMYWTMAQQITHALSNGASARAGDLWGSGTVSGPGDGEKGCLLEATRNGNQPLVLADGSRRTYLEDGDEVVLRGWCDRPGYPVIGLGECSGTVIPG